MNWFPRELRLVTDGQLWRAHPTWRLRVFDAHTGLSAHGERLGQLLGQHARGLSLRLVALTRQARRLPIDSEILSLLFFAVLVALTFLL